MSSPNRPVSRGRASEGGDLAIALLLCLSVGLLGTGILVQMGVVTLANAVKYAPWFVVGMAGLTILAFIGTKSPTDDVICTGLFITGLGGALGTYLIDNGLVTLGVLCYIGLGVLFLLILMNFAKQSREYMRR